MSGLRVSEGLSKTLCPMPWFILLVIEDPEETCPITYLRKSQVSILPPNVRELLLTAGLGPKPRADRLHG